MNAHEPDAGTIASCDRIIGELLDAQSKRRILLAYCDDLISQEEAITLIRELGLVNA